MVELKPRRDVRNYDDHTLKSYGDKIRVTANRRPRAGEFITLRVEITLGKELREGEAIAVFAPLGFGLPQVSRPTQPGYTTCKVIPSRRNAKLALSPYTQSSGAEWERAVLIRVEEGKLEKGDRLQVVFGDTAEGSPGIRCSVAAHGGLLMECFRVEDPNNEHPPMLKQSPRIAVEPAAAATVRGYATQVVGVGEETKIRLVCEDAYGNLVPVDKKVRVAGLPGGAIEVPLKKGRAEILVRMEKPGVYYPVVQSPFGTRAFGPVEVQESTPRYRLFFGELHVHTEISYDAAGSLDEVYRYARDVSCLDFAAAADHMTGAAGQHGPCMHQAGSPGIFRERFDGRWKTTVDAARRYHEPERFVTFIGFEADTTGPAEHRNVYFLGDEPDEMVLPSFPPPRDFLAKWLKGKKVMAVPHHPAISWIPGIHRGGGLNMDEVPAEYQPMVEIYSKHGTDEFLDNHRPLRGQKKGHFVQDFLEQGHKFGFIGGSDSHQANPGSSLIDAGPFRTLQYRSGLCCVWATQLTREALWEAFFARRVYATTYPRVILRFGVDELFMGEVGASPYPRRVWMEIYSAEEVNRIEVIKNGRMLAAIPPTPHPKKPNATQGIFSVEDSRPSRRKEDYYYLRIWLDNGERVWSTPVWVSNGR